VRTGTGLMHGIPVALGVMDFGYMGGSMGSVSEGGAVPRDLLQLLYSNSLDASLTWSARLYSQQLHGNQSHHHH
jgi:hypothetical protein